MANEKSNYFEIWTLYVFLQQGTYQGVQNYLALFTGDPLETGLGGPEVSGNGYARAPVDFSLGGVGGVNFAENSNTIAFQPATGSWGTITHWAIYTAATGGNQLYSGAFGASFSPAVGQSVVFAPGDLRVDEQ